MESTKQLMIIWKFTDKKPGHENQMRGLIAALEQSVRVKVVDFPVSSLPSSSSLLLKALFRREVPVFLEHEKPDLIIGAGHKTHIPMVVAQSMCGGKSVVLMRPSIPMGLFDLVVLPKHDGVPPRENSIETVGVLNAMQHVDQKDMLQGLMLIGGVSSHYVWDDEAIVFQVQEILETDPNIKWVLTTSRRTPESFVTLIRKLDEHPNLLIVEFEQTNQQWMVDHFAKSGQIWVSPDSVSMVYESLTSGAATFVFTLGPKRSKKSRIVTGLELLIRESAIISFDRWKEDPSIQPSSCVFNEASRVSEYLLEHVV